MITKGYHTARAVQCDLGFTNNGKEQVAVLFEITEGDAKGQRITWHGYFSEKSADRTLESLMHCGWDGEDLSKLTGIDRNEVSLTIEHEVSETDGKTYAKASWVNRLGGGLALKNKMDAAQKSSFADRMKGRAAALKDKSSQSDDDDFSYGANRNGGPPV